MNLRPEFLSPLRTLTGIDSPSGDAEGVTKAGDVMEGIFRNLGWETDRPEVGSYGRACVFRNHPESETADLMLCAHLDTVHSRGSAARYPFRIDEGLAFGPGVADDRSGLAAIAAIASGLPAAVKDRLSLKVVLTPAEEITPREHAEFLREASRGVPAAFIFEPGRPDGSFVRARKGSSTVRVDFRGVPAHAGNRPEDGRKAIDAMAAAIPQLKHLASEIDGTAISTGLVSGGTTANTVAEHASVTFDLRYGSDRDRDELIFRMRKLCLTGFADGVTSDLKIESLGPALPLSAESASLITLINRAAATLRLPSPVWAEAGGASDGNELASFGVAVIDALAPSGGLLHNPNKEYLDLATVEPHLRLIEKALELLASAKTGASPAR